MAANLGQFQLSDGLTYSPPEQGGTIMKLAVAALVIAMPSAAFAQAAAPAPITVIAQSSEYRFQMDFHVSDAALAKMLPAGWVSNAATQGAAKDANVRLIFIDAGNIVGPDNKLLGKGNDVLVYVAAPVKEANGPGTGQMILTGISQNQAGAAFGALVQATTAKITRTQATSNGITTVTEDWDLAAGNGEHAGLHVKYTRQPANRGGGAVNFYNPADPKSFEIYRTEQVTDITRNVTTTPPDRVSEFSYKAGGGKLGSLFDGSEKPLSWDSQPLYNRIIGVAAK
jgi:hypothetical protein